MPATPAWPPKSAPRLFVSQPLGDGVTVVIEGPQAHYLGRVMRVAPGDAVVLCDDASGEWAAQVAAVEKRAVTLVCKILQRPREAVPDFTLCAALLKKDRFDLVLEKATELGVARIQPVLTRRCVADKLNLERAQALVTEAAEQCARTALLVGPEGGFDTAERSAIRAHAQARAITLGPRILRGETAAIAGTALWMATAGDWGAI